MAKNTICLWYDKDAEACPLLCRNLSRQRRRRRPPCTQRLPLRQEGRRADRGIHSRRRPLSRPQWRPHVKHNEAFSFQIATDDQQETDRYWNAIVGNGGEESAVVGARTDGASPGRSRGAC